MTSYKFETPTETFTQKTVRYRRISDGAEFIFVANDSLGQRQTLKDVDGNFLQVTYSDLSNFEEIQDNQNLAGIDSAKEQEVQIDLSKIGYSKEQVQSLEIHASTSNVKIIDGMSIALNKKLR